jgi:hypothetical protein
MSACAICSGVHARSARPPVRNLRPGGLGPTVGPPRLASLREAGDGSVDLVARSAASPAFPFGPGLPFGPASPLRPTFPGGPVVPGSPLGPASHLAPTARCSPSGQAGPALAFEPCPSPKPNSSNAAEHTKIAAIFYMCCLPFISRKHGSLGRRSMLQENCFRRIVYNCEKSPVI